MPGSAEILSKCRIAPSKRDALSEMQGCPVKPVEFPRMGIAPSGVLFLPIEKTHGRHGVAALGDIYDTTGFPHGNHTAKQIWPFHSNHRSYA